MTNALPNEHQLAYTIRQSAEILSVSHAHVYKLIHDGTIQSFTLGKNRRISRAELERVIAEATAADFGIKPHMTALSRRNRARLEEKRRAS